MLTLEELRYAWFQVRRGSKSAGIDGITVDSFAGVAEEQLQTLLRQLQYQSYRPSPAKGFYVPKKDGKKRLIGIATVRDRIVQRLLLEELYTPLENVFLDCSYAYRQGRNIQQAVQHLFGYYQYQPKWVIKADIENFFGNVCWALLLSALENLQLEPIVLQLLKQQLQAGIVINGKTTYPEKGLLQGGVLSGALANLYLTDFDNKCLQDGINLVRYGDDFAMACSSWVEANLILDKISTWLGNLYLTLQPEKTQIYVPKDEFIFLGYRFAKGEVFAPPPPIISTSGEWLVNDSGTPYFRPKERAAKFVSRRPKACDISKPSKLPTAPISHLWQESMSTLYVTDQGSYISVKNQQFQVFYQRELKIKIPVFRVSYIVIFGCCNISHGAIKMALKRCISIIYLSRRGWYFGKIESQGMPKVEHLIRQVECSLNPEFVRKQAEAIVRGKLHNSRIILMRLNRLCLRSLVFITHH